MASSSIRYTANTGAVNISTANSNLNGTGSMGTVLTGALDGTLIKSVTIKAAGSTSEGMVRLFINPGGGPNIFLFKEIPIPASVQTAEQPAVVVTIRCNFTLNSGDLLKASTQVADSFNVIADALDFESCDCA